MFVDTAEACGVCGAPHSTCKPAGNTDSEGVGTTRGVIVRLQEPGRVVVPIVTPGATAIPTAAPPAAKDERPLSKRPVRKARG